MEITAGATSVLVDVFIQDSSSAVGAGLTGLAFGTAGLTAYYHRDTASSAVAITLATMTLGTWATGGFIVVDATNQPGLYQIGIPNAAFAAGAKSVIVYLKGATNMAPMVMRFPITVTDNQDGVRGGMTALPNANAAATGGLATVDSSNAVKVQSGTAANQINLSSGLVTLAGVTHTGAVIPTVTTTGTATAVTTVNGLASGVITATSIASSAITAAKFATDAIDANALAAGAVTEIQSGLATPTNITAGTITNLTNAPTAGGLTATMKADVTAAVPTAAANATAVGNILTSTLTTAGSLGKLIVDNLNATISSVYSRLGAPAGASIAADLVAIEAETSNIQTRIPTALTSGRMESNTGAMSNNVITAAAIATNAFDADALATDAVTEIATAVSAFGAPTVADIDAQLSGTHGAGSWASATGFATPANVTDATSSINGTIGALNNLDAAGVWSYGGTRELTDDTPTAAEIWAYTGSGGRTLTSPTPGSTQPPVIVGGSLNIVRAVSFDTGITGMVIPSNWSKVYFTVKTSTAVADSASLIQIVVTSGGDAGDGLLFVNGAVAGTLAAGTMTINQSAGSATISITDDETAVIVAGSYVYDLKVITAASKSTVLSSGQLTVGLTPTFTV